MDGIHPLYPFHLFLCSRFLCRALLCLHLPGQFLQPLLTDAIDFQQAFHELFRQQKTLVRIRPVLFEVAQAHLPVLPQKALLCFGQAQDEQKVVSVVMIRETS